MPFIEAGVVDSAVAAFLEWWAKNVSSWFVINPPQPPGHFFRGQPTLSLPVCSKGADERGGLMAANPRRARTSQACRDPFQFSTRKEAFNQVWRFQISDFQFARPEAHLFGSFHHRLVIHVKGGDA